VIVRPDRMAERLTRKYGRKEVWWHVQEYRYAHAEDTFEHRYWEAVQYFLRRMNVCIQ